jgi:hypothetical protein
LQIVEATEMKAYIWILELAAVGGLFLLARWALHWRKERGTRAAHAVRNTSSAASRAERDRLECLALEAKLGDGGAASQEPARPSMGAARAARRGSSAYETGFDPDLPPAPKSDGART